MGSIFPQEDELSKNKGNSNYKYKSKVSFHCVIKKLNTLVTDVLGIEKSVTTHFIRKTAYCFARLGGAYGAYDLHYHARHNSSSSNVSIFIIIKN